jgi:hypothetical protein
VGTQRSFRLYSSDLLHVVVFLSSSLSLSLSSILNLAFSSKTAISVFIVNVFDREFAELREFAAKRRPLRLYYNYLLQD